MNKHFLYPYFSFLFRLLVALQSSAVFDSRLKVHAYMPLTLRKIIMNVLEQGNKELVIFEINIPFHLVVTGNIRI